MTKLDVLHKREQGTKQHQKSNGVRQIYSHVTPNHTLFDVNIPLECLNIRRFTPDGKYLISFTGCQQGVRIYFLHNLVYDDNVTTQAILSPTATRSFYHFFSLKYTSMLHMPDNHQLYIEFCLITKNQKHMILASSGPSTRVTRQNSYELDIPITLNDYAFYIVEIHTGQVVDECHFKQDYIHLTDHAGVGILDDRISILCIQTQTIHVFEIKDSGTLNMVYLLDPCLTYRKNDETENRSHADEEEMDSDISSITSNEGSLKSDNHALNEQTNNGSPTAPNDDWGLAVPESISHSFMTARSLEGLLENNEFYSSSASIDGETFPGARPYSEFTHTLLVWLFNHTIEKTESYGKQYFYCHFNWFLDLKLWRMQFIGHHRLLIKMSTLPANFNIRGNNPYDTMNMALFIIFNITKSSIEDVFDNTSNKVADLLLNNGACLYNGVYAAKHKPCFSAPGSNTLIERGTLQKKIESWSRPEKGGSYALAMQKLSFNLPRPPDPQSDCPYFDFSLFRYSNNLNPLQNWSKCPLLEKIKFYSKETTQFKFMIDAGLGTDNPEQNLNQEKFITYIIPNPTYPFIITKRQRVADRAIINTNFHVYKHNVA
ncbi:De-etiolated protein 1 Det1-domain-containing protein [Circinella umbellata]|nr:De-etiolated protein 1 Det1-domain-containing protein [Circinella umbellata]